MDRFWAVAPPAIWALLTLSSAFLMVGFVLLSHTLVRAKAHGDAWRGLLADGRLESTVRLGIGSLLLGGALFAPALDAPPAFVWTLAGAGAVVVAMELVARTR